MPYLGIIPLDPTVVDWVLSDTEEDGTVTLRPEYTDLGCSNCGKVDEYAAVKRGVFKRLDLPKSRKVPRDFLWMADHFLVASLRFVEVVASAGLSGLQFVTLPGNPDHRLLLPERVPASFGLSGLYPQPHGPHWRGGRPTGWVTPRPIASTDDHRCPACGRHFETLGVVSEKCLDARGPRPSFFRPSFNHESERGDRFDLYCTEHTGRVLMEHKLTGFRLNQMGTGSRWRYLPKRGPD